jgi:hypothetical protein
MSVQHPADPDKRGRHPSKEDPREQGKCRVKETTAKIIKKIPGIPSLKALIAARQRAAISFLKIERG